MQIEVFWLRAINDQEFKRIFCLIHAEKLSYKVSDQALNSLSKHSQGAKGKHFSHFVSHYYYTAPWTRLSFGDNNQQ